MLEIFNNLRPFFEDTFLEVSVRDYSRKINVSPPTASTILKKLEKENILVKEKKGIYLFFRINKDIFFKDLAKAYWRNTLSKLFKDIHEIFLYKQIILFGSVSKSENDLNSDVDIYIDLPKRNIDLKAKERILKRKIQLHFIEVKKNKNLWKNIKRGIVIL
jgi:predicted nucleotidyltransferase